MRALFGTRSLKLVAGATLAVLGVLGASPAGSAAVRADPVHAWANTCVRLGADGQHVGRDGTSYELSPDGGVFFLEPTGLGTFLLYEPDASFMAVEDRTGEAGADGETVIDGTRDAVARAGDALTVVEQLRPIEEALDDALAATDQPVAEGSRRPVGLQNAVSASPLAEWQLRSSAAGYRLVSTWAPVGLGVLAGDLALVAEEASTVFTLTRSPGCTPFPEVDPGGVGELFRGTASDGTVRGFADTHTHVAAFLRLGGETIHGRPFHPFGVAHALPDGAERHGENGTADVLGNILRHGVPAGTHATDGYPTFTDWPSNDTYTHQQSYYVWLQRLWMAGLRLMVVHVNADEQMCQLLPRTSRDCDEMDGARIQLAYLRELQDYVDAQAGGPGEGFFRIVTDPAQARRVIEDGKVAIVLGVESSKLFGCGEFEGVPECTVSEIDAGIAEMRDLGVSSLFLAHWFDNAFAGAGLFGQSERFLNLLNKLETGHYYAVEDCPGDDQGAHLESDGFHVEQDTPLTGLVNDAQWRVVPTYGAGPHCNAKGLTELGEHLVRSLADAGFIIETDHISVKARDGVLDIAEEIGHPVVSGHFHAGGVTSEEQFRRLMATGGIAAPINPTPEGLPATVRTLEALADDEYYFGVPFATDTGGLAELPDAPVDPIDYPFSSWDGTVEFDRQRTGERTFDLNDDGVAHYGLYADWIEAVRRQPDGEHAVEQMFRSAEAYLQMWERAAGTAEVATPTGAAPAPSPLPSTGGGLVFVGSGLLVGALSLARRR